MARSPESGRLSLIARGLLALGLLLAPLGARQAAPAAALTICAAEGGLKQVPNPLAPTPLVPAGPAHGHCDACLAAPPALPVPAAALRPPAAIRIAWAGQAARHPAPPALPPEQARAPPAA